MSDGRSLAEAWDLVERLWREDLHPRASDGKFGSGGPSGGGAKPSAPKSSGGKGSAPKASKPAAAKSSAGAPTAGKSAAAKSAPAAKKTPATKGASPKVKDKAWQDTHYAEWKQRLTPAQSRAISAYQGDDYALMNAQLRSMGKNGVKDPTYSDEEMARAGRANRALIDAIRKAPPTTEPMTVHRTMTAKMAAGLKPGATVGDKGFVSASLSPQKTSKGATVEIDLPEGTKAAVGANGEMILPSSGRFRVVSVEDGPNGNPHVRMEFVPHGAKAKTDATDAAPKAAATKPQPKASTNATPAAKPEPKAAQAKTPPAKDKAWLDDHYGEWREGLSPAQDKAMRFYQSPGFALMNGQLRGLKKEDIKADVSFNDDDLARARKASTALKAAIKAAPPLTEEMTVYRGFSADQFGDLTPGKMISDKGFTSTSITDDAGSVGKASNPATAEITLPVGTKAAAGSSREMVLPPGSKFRVVSVEDRGGVPHVRMELVLAPEPKAKKAPAKDAPDAKSEPKAADSKTSPKPDASPEAPQASPEERRPGMRDATRHLTHQEGVDWLDEKMLSPKKKPFVPADRSAVKNYTGENYKRINSALRNPGDERDPEVQARIDGIDAAMAKSTVPEDVVVHRGVGSDYVERLGADPRNPASMRALIGKVATEDAYVSTSAGGKAAFDDKPVRLMVRVPKGHHAINAMPISKYPDERELLLDRGTSWVVHDAYESGGKWHVEVEVVPTGWQPDADWRPDPAGDAAAGYAPGAEWGMPSTGSAASTPTGSVDSAPASSSGSGMVPPGLTGTAYDDYMDYLNSGYSSYGEYIDAGGR